MKKLFLIAILSTSSFISQSQYLQTGIFTIDTLTSVSYYTAPAAPLCSSWNLHFYTWVFPYATGMDLYVRIDSIAGPANSIYLYYYPTVMYDTVNAGDSILLSSSQPDLYVFYNYTARLYISLQAIGTPTVSGEQYYCSYNTTSSLSLDGCGQWVSFFSPVLSPLCYVDGPTGEKEPEDLHITLFPNPTSDEIKIENSELKIKEIEMYSSLGEKVFSQPETSNQQHITISVADFPPGIYFITVTDQAGNKVTRKVVKM